MPLVSVILPARDVVDDVGPCLDDLARQTLTDLEVLVVDDGSVDGTAEVIDAAADRDPRFRPLSTGGAGPSAARNRALAEARGELLAFVDADDRCSVRYLETMHAAMAAGDADLVSCNVRRLVGYETRPSGLHAQAIRRARTGTHLSAAPELVYDTTVWNKLIRRSLWEETGLAFPEGRWINDIFPSLRTHVAATRTDVLTDVLYYWRVRTDRGESITGSKFYDPQARLKSLDDRFFALDTTRAMLADELGDGPVLEAFDHRVLWHDLRAYLSMVPDADGADDAYPSTVLARTRDYLRRHHVDPARHPLGRLLAEVYAAVLDRDLERFVALLDPRVEVAAAPHEGELCTVLHTPEPVRQRRRLRSPRRRAVGGRQPVGDALEARLRIHRLHLDPTGDGPLEIAGVARIADGRSDLLGAWQLTAVLRGAGTDAVVGGRPSPVPDPARDGSHPLMHGGWRPFRVTLDPQPLATHADEDVWHLDLRLQAGGLEVPTTVEVRPAAERTVGHGRTLAPGLDLVPVPTRGGLRLQREPSPVRLLASRPAADGGMALRLHVDAPEGDGVQLRLQEPDGTVVADTALAPAVDDEELRDPVLPRPAAAVGAGTRWELWCRTADGDHRVRVAPGLRAAPWPGLAADDVGVAVVRATVRGRVVVASTTRRLEVDDVAVTDEAGRRRVRLAGLVVGRDAPARIEARCRWSGARVRGRVEMAVGTWTALLPLDALVGEVAGVPVPRPWTLHAVADDGTVDRVGVPAEQRHRLPLTAAADDQRVELAVAAGSAALLRIRPAADDAEA